MSPQQQSLSHFSAILVDIHGTLIDWESGLYNALRPLLSDMPAASNWTSIDALTAFISVERDLAVSTEKDTKYDNLLAAAYVAFAKRLSNSEAAGAAAVELQEGAGTSTSASGEERRISQETSPSRRFGESVRQWPVYPGIQAALHILAQHYILIGLSHIDSDTLQVAYPILASSSTPHSLFSCILTPQDLGSHALGLFPAALHQIQQRLKIAPSDVLLVGPAFRDDAVNPDLNLAGAWIEREGSQMSGRIEGVRWIWHFDTMKELADTVESSKDCMTPKRR